MLVCLKGGIKVKETRLNAFGPLYVKKPPKYWSNLGESLIKTRNATTGAPMHTVPESLYSFRFWFSQISVFYNRKF